MIEDFKDRLASHMDKSILKLPHVEVKKETGSVHPFVSKPLLFNEELVAMFMESERIDKETAIEKCCAMFCNQFNGSILKMCENEILSKTQVKDMEKIDSRVDEKIRMYIHNINKLFGSFDWIMASEKVGIFLEIKKVIELCLCSQCCLNKGVLQDGKSYITTQTISRDIVIVGRGKPIDLFCDDLIHLAGKERIGCRAKVEAKGEFQAFKIQF
jgi:hypothetical protein